MSAANLPSWLLPPVNRSMQVLDRAFFKKEGKVPAAVISNVKQLASVRTVLKKSNEVFQIRPIRPIPGDNDGGKVVLLNPKVNLNDPNTWSPGLRDLVDNGIARLEPYPVTMTYDDWSMYDILSAVLPEVPDPDNDLPTGFAQVGHVAHVNLRNAYLPYKFLIGEVLKDKNLMIKTVINKVQDVGTESVFRTFPYEVLAGTDDLDVTVHESDCEFQFNFGKVYWNSRLSTEHARIVDKIQPGEAICDVMAGVGPFAIPAAKKGVWVWANDLNPASYEGLVWAAKRNKCEEYIHSACTDGRLFIRQSVTDLPSRRRSVKVRPKMKFTRDLSPQRLRELHAQIARETKTVEEPATFGHFIMNLPATAIEFLDAFKGVYSGQEKEFVPHTNKKLPFIHLYLFQFRHDTEEEDIAEIWQRISHHIGTEVRPDDASLEAETLPVRLVSPKKRMWCASFRLPESVAFGN